MASLSAPRPPAWIEIDQAALAHNAGVLRRAIPANTRLGILVKANGYGHDLHIAARAALAGGADQLIVATFDEGLALRTAGVAAPIMVAYPIATADAGQAAGADLELTVSGLNSTRQLVQAWPGEAPPAPPGPVKLHVEVDTGMGRGGVRRPDLAEVLRLIEDAPQTAIAGIWSHLADGGDSDVSAEQARRFDEALAQVAAAGVPIPRRHLLATDALFAATAPAYDMVRIGLGFYGQLGLDVEPAAELAELAAQLRPAMMVKARPVRLEALDAGGTVGYGGEWSAERRSLIATLPIGYADGWTRGYWPGASALVRGQRVPLVGRVSMDSVCADVTEVEGAKIDDEFVLLGSQGSERITVGELARLRGSIPNEVFCAFGPRLPRVAVDGPAG
jgi:alanine racemase